MQNLIKKIVEILNDKKAENIEVIDMQNKNYICDFVIIADILASRHALSLIDELKTKLKPFGANFLNIEESDDWSVVDLGDIIIHLMSQTYRAKYNIEELLDELKKDLNK